eukprot:Skav218110  [mRNA]  locus=scaffold759:178356:179048:+ [translate_table: standard]
MSLVAAGELAPVAPSEGNAWRSGENFQQLPWKGSESIVKFLMRLFPRNARRVIELCGATTEKHVVVAHRIGLLVVVLLPTVGAHMELLRVHTAVLVRIHLVRTFHLPSLHQILHDELEGPLCMVFGLALKVLQIRQGIVWGTPKPPFDALLIHETPLGFSQSKLLLDSLQLLSACSQLFSSQRLARACRRQGSTHVRLRHGGWRVNGHSSLQDVFHRVLHVFFVDQWAAG